MPYTGIHCCFKNEQIYEKKGSPTIVFCFFRGRCHRQETKKTDAKSVLCTNYIKPLLLHLVINRRPCRTNLRNISSHLQVFGMHGITLQIFEGIKFTLQENVIVPVRCRLMVDLHLYPADLRDHPL